MSDSNLRKDPHLTTPTVDARTKLTYDDNLRGSICSLSVVGLYQAGFSHLETAMKPFPSGDVAGRRLETPNPSRRPTKRDVNIPLNHPDIESPRSNSGAGVGESGAAAGAGGELENSARRAAAAAAMDVDRASMQVERASNALDLACFLRDAALSFLQK